MVVLPISLVIWEQSAAKRCWPSIDHCCTVGHRGELCKKETISDSTSPFQQPESHFPKSVLLFSTERVSSGASLSGTYWISWLAICNSSLLAKLSFYMVPSGHLCTGMWLQLLKVGRYDCWTLASWYLATRPALISHASKVMLKILQARL